MSYHSVLSRRNNGCESRISRHMSEQSMCVLGKPWKGKYEIDWCGLCDCAIIICPSCGNCSCNGGGCPECLKDWPEFKVIKKHVQDYLTPEEHLAYEKGHRLKRMIMESIAAGQPEIDWKKQDEAGKLSENDREMFKKFL